MRFKRMLFLLKERRLSDSLILFFWQQRNSTAMIADPLCCCDVEFLEELGIFATTPGLAMKTGNDQSLAVSLVDGFAWSDGFSSGCFAS